MINVFLSYSSHDRELAVRIAEGLQRRPDIDVWLDTWRIHVGDSITQLIEIGLDEADFILVLLTEQSVTSGWVEKEWRNKIADEAESRQVTILPLKGDECVFPRLLGEKRFADFTSDFDTSIDEVVTAIRKHFADRTPDKTQIREQVKKLIVGPHIPKHRQIADLVRSLGGQISFTLSKNDYPTYFNFFEGLSANRQALCRPGSSLRSSDMPLELSRYLYAKRDLNASELIATQQAVNERANRLSRLLDHSQPRFEIEEFYPISALDAFIGDKTFVKTRQALCEIKERIQTIRNNLRDHRDNYCVYLFTDDATPFFDHFFLKIFDADGTHLLYALVCSGAVDRDRFMVFVNHEEQTEYEETIEDLRNQARSIKQFPQGHVFRVREHDLFTDWIDKHTSFPRVKSCLPTDGKPCLMHNVPYCPVANCPASDFTSIYNHIDALASKRWKAIANNRRVLFSRPSDKPKYGIALVAELEFDAEGQAVAEQLRKTLKSEVDNEGCSIEVTNLAKWHSTIAGFRRSRDDMWTKKESPYLEIIDDAVGRIQPFKVCFNRLVWCPDGAIILCGVLDEDAVSNLNHLRNELICEQRDESSWFDVRHNIDAPKNRMAFHATIATFNGVVALDHLQELSEKVFLSRELSTMVDSFALLHYSRRDCSEQLGERLNYLLGQRRGLSHDEICQKLRLG